MPTPVTSVHLAEYWVTVQFCEAHRFKIVVRWKWEMWQKKWYTCENIPVLSCSDDMTMIINPTNHRRAQNLVWSAFPGYLLIPTFRFWCCPVHTSDVNLLTLFSGAWMIAPIESCMLTEMDGMDSIVWLLAMVVLQSSCSAIWFPPHNVGSNFQPTQWCFLLNQGYV